MLATRFLLYLLLSHFVVDFFIGVWPIYKTLAGLNLAQAGLIAGIAGFCGELSQLFFGYWSDRGGRHRAIFLGSTLACAAVLFPYAEGFWGLLLLLLAVMTGSGALHPAGMGAASLLGRGPFPQAPFWFAAAGALGLALSQMVFVHLHTVLAGQTIYLAAILVVVAVLAMTSSVASPTTVTPSIRSRAFWTPFQEAWRSLLLLYAAQVLNYGLALAFMFLLPDLLREKGCSPWLQTGGGHLCFVLGGAGMLLARGTWGSMLHPKWLIALCLACGGVLLECFLRVPSSSSWTIASMLVLIGCALYVINPLIIVWGHTLLPQHPSSVSALLMGAAWSLSSIFPPLAGAATHLFSDHPIASSCSLLMIPLILTLLLVSLGPTRTVLPSKAETTSTHHI